MSTNANTPLGPAAAGPIPSFPFMEAGYEQRPQGGEAGCTCAGGTPDQLETLRRSLDGAVQEALKSFHEYVAVAVSQAVSLAPASGMPSPGQSFPATRFDPGVGETPQVTLAAARKAQLDSALAAAFAEDETTIIQAPGAAAPSARVVPPAVVPPAAVPPAVPPVAAAAPPAVVPVAVVPPAAVPPAAVPPAAVPPPLPPAVSGGGVPPLPPGPGVPGRDSPFTVVHPREANVPPREPAVSSGIVFGQPVPAWVPEGKAPPMAVPEPLPFSPFQGLAPVSASPAPDRQVPPEPSPFRPLVAENALAWLPPPPAGPAGSGSVPAAAGAPPLAPPLVPRGEAASQLGAVAGPPLFGSVQAATAPFRVVEPPPVCAPVPAGSAPSAQPPVAPAAVPPPVPPAVGPGQQAAAGAPPADIGFNFAELLRANGQQQ